MLTVSTNDKNDIYLDALGDIATSSNGDALQNILVNDLSVALGEIVLDIATGIDFENTVFTSPVNLSAFKQQCIKAIESREDVNGVEDFSITINEGVLRYVAKVDSIYGSVFVNG